MWVRIPADVPIHRGSVGAMALASGSQMPDQSTEFKPYVYRGWGYDLFEDEVVIERPEPKPKPKKRKRKPRPKWWSDRPRLNFAPELPHPPYAPATYWTPKPAPSVPLIPLPPIRPAPGWRPTSGDDIDSLLEELNGDRASD